ncbi:GntR family transcriptional regulator [Streptomyces sp. Qhu_M48]|uniref:GntR family transcriptional regulator n=1 Tax=Streptomyces sp. Qhu_M48 TaxID=3435889 RepID=UPI003F50B9C8
MTLPLMHERHGKPDTSNPAGTVSDSKRPSGYAHLRSALARVHGAAKSRPHRTPNEAERDREKVWALVEPWIARAEACRDQADTSPADRARWEGLLAAVRRPDRTPGPIPSLESLTYAAASLLRGLMEAETPGPGVREIADHVRASIKNGAYLPGTRLAAGRIAAEMGSARTLTSRVELAFQDLQTEGLIARSATRSWWVDAPVDRPEQIAALLRRLIQAGVYPPGGSLPPAILLARSLVSSTSDVSEAVRKLRDEGSVASSPGFGTRVCATQPFPVPHSLALDALVDRLKTLTVSSADLSHLGIRGRCGQAQAWWKKRISPPASVMEHTRGYLITAVLHLLPQASESAEAASSLRRVATLVFDSSDTPADRLWLTACLAAVAAELLAEREAGGTK